MRRSIVAALAGCCLAGALAVPAAEPAEAVTLQTVTVSSARNSSSNKSIAAICPPGTELYGGGARILGGEQVVTFLGMRPYVSTAVSGYWAVAFESPIGDGHQDFTDSWQLQVFARCGTGLSGVEQVTEVVTIADRSPTRYEATAHCPPGKVVIGAGFGSSYISVPVHWIRPILDGTAVQVVLHEDRFNSAYATDPVTVIADALCASPPPGWRIVTQSTQPMPFDPQSQVASCMSGKVLGGGLTMFEGDTPGAYRITGYAPHLNGGSFTVQGGSLFTKPISTGWALGSWAICADA
jgi:hypothetical protein